MPFSVNDLEETLGLQEVEDSTESYYEDDEFADVHEDEMEEQFEEIMMGNSRGLLEEIYVVANGNPNERRMIIASGGMDFIYKADPGLSFRLFDVEKESLFTMNYYWSDMVTLK